MKSQLNQIFTYVTKIDYRHFQLAYFAIMLAATFIAQKPSEGGIGPS